MDYVHSCAERLRSMAEIGSVEEACEVLNVFEIREYVKREVRSEKDVK